MLKKGFLLIVALLLISTISACSPSPDNNGKTPPKNGSNGSNGENGERFKIDTSQNLFGDGVNAPAEIVCLVGGELHSSNLGLKAWQYPTTIKVGNVADVYWYEIDGYTIEEIFDFYLEHLSDYVVSTETNYESIKYIEFIVGDYSSSGDGYGGVVDLSIEDGIVIVAFWIYYYE